MAETRAEKSGFAREAQAKIHGKYDEQLAGQVLQWIANVSGQSINTSGDMDNFVNTLRDGKVVCGLANSLQNGSVRKINDSKMPFKQMENISFFLQFAEKYLPKAELFQTADLFEATDPNMVAICLSSLARKSEKNFGVPGFGPKESSGEKRVFTEEQLRAGSGVIGLQMGTNQGANQSGMNMGKTRHIVD